MSRLKLAATTAALLGGLAITSAAQAFTFLELDSKGQIFEYSSTAGSYTPVGTGPTVLEGLGEIGKSLYGVTATGQLYSISATGAESTDGTASLPTGVTSYVDFGSTTTALYAIGNNGDLYSIDRYNGDASLVGSLDLSGVFTGHTDTIGTGKSAVVNTIGLSTGSSTLYFADGTNMYALNLTTGAAGTATAITEATPLTTTAGDFGALLFEGGTLYGGADTYGNGMHTGLVSFNGSDQYTALVETSPNNTHATAFWGMAMNIPEPSEWALMLAGVGAVGGALRARRRKATAAA
jgi:hypothetical protein